MNRKEFLEKCVKAGLCCCGAAIGMNHGLLRAQDQSPPAHGWIADLESRMINGSATPAWRKIEKSANWIKDLMNNMDAMLDQETRVKLLQATGRACYLRAFGAASEEKPSPQAVERTLGALKSGGHVRHEGDTTIITYRWGRKHQNPSGLIIQDGYCMCPVVESGPPGLSPTYCQCSTGYVKESFERSIGRSVNVTLIESLKMGGQDCVFRVEVPGKL